MVKSQFSIKDLEHLSGVKAHTIRIWEKRYKLLEPARSQTNIRSYDLDNLKKLLNVTFLYSQGYKISKIAALNPTQITDIIATEHRKENTKTLQYRLKKGMLGFQQAEINDVFKTLKQQNAIAHGLESVIFPFLHEVGILWQLGVIDPIHERFFSELVKHCITREIASTQIISKPQNSPTTFVLFLPEKEIHDIGLLYVYYLLVLAQQHVIYLGNNIPLDNLPKIHTHFTNPIYLSYLTVQPETPIDNYITQYKLLALDTPFWLMGYKIKDLQLEPTLSKNVRLLQDFNALRNAISNL